MSNNRSMNIDSKSNELFTPTNPGYVSQTGSNVTDGQTLWTPGMLYNETTSDKPRGNTQGTLLASAARTAGLYAPIITNYNARGVIITINVTAIGGTTPQLTFQLNDGSNNGYSPSSTAITAIGISKFVLYPGASTAPSNSIGSFQLPLGRQWGGYFNITGTAPSFTFSAIYELIL